MISNSTYKNGIARALGTETTPDNALLAVANYVTQNPAAMRTAQKSVAEFLGHNGLDQDTTFRAHVRSGFRPDYDRCMACLHYLFCSRIYENHFAN